MNPDVERLARRLAQTPLVFFAPVDPSKPDAVRVDAVVADLFRDRAARPLEPAEVARFRPKAADSAGQKKAARRHLQLVLVGSWLLHDPAFQSAAAEPLLTLLDERLRRLSELVQPRAFVEDGDRREELVRTCLAAAGIVPIGESAALSQDRLATLDSIRRHDLLRDAQVREAARERHRKDLERVRAQEEEDRRKAARTTFQD